MLRGSQSISFYSPGNIALWFAMAFQAGMLNIGGFMAGHQIVSHMTGLFTFVGASMAERDFSRVLMLLLVPLFFLMGSMISGFFVDLRIRQNKRPKYYITFFIMFALNLIVLIGGMAGSFGPWGNESGSLSLLILLCLICGIQNGTVSVVSKSVIRTTHVTGIMTDLGLGLVKLLNRNKIKHTLQDETKANLVRFGILNSFIIGSAAGGLCFSSFQYLGFIVPVVISGLLLALMLYFQMWRHPL